MRWSITPREVEVEEGNIEKRKGSAGVVAAAGVIGGGLQLVKGFT